MLEGSGAGREAEETYVANKVRDGIYFVDFLRHLERAATVSLVLDLRFGSSPSSSRACRKGRKPGTRSWTASAEGEELTSVRATFPRRRP